MRPPEQPTNKEMLTIILVCIGFWKLMEKNVKMEPKALVDKAKEIAKLVFEQ